MSTELLLAISLVVAFCGGLIRGVTGFGGSMVMTPAFSLLFDPRQVVPTVLLLETLAALPMLRSALREAELRFIATSCLVAVLTVPLGSALLASLDVQVLRYWIAGTVLTFSLLLLAKFRYNGPRNQVMSGAVGALSGVLLGGTGIGGPPMIIYLLSSDAPIRITRASLTLFVSLISVAGLVMLWYNDLLTFTGEMSPVFIGPVFYLGIIVGVRCFHHLSEKAFRQVTLVFLILISIITFLR